jgi:uncharacterized protein
MDPWWDDRGVSEPSVCPLPLRIERAIDVAAGLGDVLPGVVAIGLAGSWARGSGRVDSDIDIIVLTADPGAALNSTAWFSVFGAEVWLIRRADFGAIQERRLSLPDGVVMEIGFGSASWAVADPVEQGTRTVMEGGFRVLHDPHNLLGALGRAVDARDRCGL